jgi:Peptidase A4 family
MAESDSDSSSPASSDEGFPQDVTSILRAAFEPLPKDFDPLKEDNSVLVKHGFPAQPETIACLRLKVWKQVFSRRPKFITPTFSPLPLVPRRPLPELPLPIRFTTDASLCGAFLPVPASGSGTEYIYGAWTIPKAYPPVSAHGPDGITDGSWSFKIWMEIDGVYTKRVGTTQEVIVSDGQIASQTAYAWVGSPRGAILMSEAQITSLPVGPGDVVAFSICQKHTEAADGGLITAHNIGHSTFTSMQMFPAPKSPLIGTIVKWMVELPPVASYEDSVQHGNVVMSNCSAGYGRQGMVFKLDNANLIDTKLGDKYVSNVTIKGGDMVVISGQ